MSHRHAVGPESKYDLIGALQFNNLVSIGMREHHKLLDIGCGSLRGGRFSIIYLAKGNYFGIEPSRWLVEKGIEHETGQELIRMKSPNFNDNNEFDFSIFNTEFDYLIAQSIFSHTSKNQILNCCKSAHNVMKSDSIFICTYINGNNNYEGDDWVGEGVAYTFYFMKSLIESTGLKCELVNEWHHPNGQTWLKITK